jgi:hypothetical protein
MLRELEALFKEATVLQVVATVAAFASIVAALYTQRYLERITRRRPDAGKRFNSEVRPWMAEARRRYAKERLSGGDKSRL